MKVIHINQEIFICFYRNNEVFWKNRKEPFITYKQIYENKKRNFYILCLFDVVKETYLIYRKQFSKIKIEYFNSKKEAFTFIENSEKNIIYEDFIKESIKLIKNKEHPLLKKHIPNIFFNPISKEIYTGINYFLIYNKSYLENNLNNTIFYSNINIKEHHILLKEKKHHGIIIQNNNNYNLLVPENILIKNPLSNTLNVEYKISLDKSNTLINDFISFFECMFNQTLYIPQNTKNIKKIINNPDLYIEILSNIQNTIEEKLYVQKTN